MFGFAKMWMAQRLRLSRRRCFFLKSKGEMMHALAWHRHSLTSASFDRIERSLQGLMSYVSVVHQPSTSFLHVSIEPAFFNRHFFLINILLNCVFISTIFWIVDFQSTFFLNQHSFYFVDGPLLFLKHSPLKNLQSFTLSIIITILEQHFWFTLFDFFFLFFFFFGFWNAFILCRESLQMYWYKCWHGWRGCHVEFFVHCRFHMAAF